MIFFLAKKNKRYLFPTRVVFTWFFLLRFITMFIFIKKTVVLQLWILLLYGWLFACCARYTIRARISQCGIRKYAIFMIYNYYFCRQLSNQSSGLKFKKYFIRQNINCIYINFLVCGVSQCRLLGYLISFNPACVSVLLYIYIFIGTDNIARMR